MLHSVPVLEQKSGL